MLDSLELTIVGYVLIGAEVLGVALAVDAVMHPRSSQGAIAWFIALITLPVVTVPLYAVFGRTRFQGYTEALREAETSVGVRARDWLQRMSTLAAEPRPGLEVIETLCTRLTNIPFLRANRVELLIDGAATYDAMISAIESARVYVLVQFYIVRDDAVGRRLRDALISKARSGVQLYRYRDRFMHQKVILIDDSVAGVGTVNLDNRSLYLNFEATALVADKDFIGQIETMLSYDLRNSSPVLCEHFDHKPLPFRAAARIARLASPLL